MVISRSTFRCIPSIALSIATSVASLPNAFGDMLMVSFSGPTTSFIGPPDVLPSNPTSLLAQGLAVNPDLLSVDGQFIVRNFTPGFTGTYSFQPGPTSDPNVEFLLHSVLLERIETVTRRIGDGAVSPNGFATNRKVLLPRTVTGSSTDEGGLTTVGFFGSGSLNVVNGVPTSMTYSAGPEVLASFDFRVQPSSIESLVVGGSQFSSATLFDLNNPGNPLAGLVDANLAPYGFNSTLMNIDSVVSSTVINTTRGLLASELAVDNIRNRTTASGGVPIANPLTDSGILYHYSGVGFGASVVVESVPEPGSAMLVALR